MRACLYPCRSTTVLSVVNPYSASKPFLAAVAGMLDAAERQLDAAARAVVVDEYLAALHRARHAQLAAAVARPHAGDQPEVGRIGEAHGVGFIGERHRGQHGAEHFVACQPMIGWHVAQQRRRHVESAGRRVGDDRSLARRRANAVACGIGEKTAHALELRFANQRTAIEIGQRRTRAQRRRSVRQGARALPRSASARPAGGCRPSRSGPAFCTIALTSAGNAASRSASANTICGDLPPSSSVTGQWRLRRGRRDPRARRGRTGERNVRDAGMLGERCARLACPGPSRC